jgi:hypothetical protein
MPYCTRADVHTFGVRRGALSNPARLSDSVDASANTITLGLHGLALNDTVTVRADAGGTLPAPLVASTTYYAIPVSDGVFQVAAAEDGAAINFTTAGSRLVVITPVPYDAAIAWADRMIDDMLPAHVVPVAEPIPEIVKMTSAELAGGKLAALLGSESVSLTATVEAAQKRLARWASGIPIRGDDAPTPTNLAAAASAPYADIRGWGRFGGI